VKDLPYAAPMTSPNSLCAGLCAGIWSILARCWAYLLRGVAQHRGAM